MGNTLRSSDQISAQARYEELLSEECWDPIFSVRCNTIDIVGNTLRSSGQISTQVRFVRMLREECWDPFFFCF